MRIVCFLLLCSVMRVWAFPPQPSLSTHKRADTLRCFLLDHAIEEENDPVVWIRYNRELMALVSKQLKEHPEGGDVKTYRRYLSTAYNNEGAYCVYTESYEKAIRHYRKSLDIARKLRYQKGIAIALQNIGTAYDYLGKLDSTLVYLERAYSAAVKSGDRESIAYVLTDLGFVHNNLGNNFLAIQYNLRALPLFEKMRDEDGIERTYFALGRIFDNQNDYRTSISYYEKCVAIARRTKNGERLMLALSGLSQACYNLGDRVKARSYNDAFFKLAKAGNNLDFVASAYRNYGDIAAGDGNMAAARRDFLESVRTYEQIGSDLHVAKVCIRLVPVLLSLGQVTEAEMYGRKAYQLSIKTGFPSDRRDAADVLSQVYAKKGDFGRAYLYKKEAAEIDRKTFFDESKETALKATFQYEAQKKEAKIRSLAQQKEIAELKAGQKAMMLYAVGIIFIVLALAGYFFYQKMKAGRKSELLKARLEESEKRIEAEKRAVESELKALKSQMNPHFIFNALNSIQEQFMFGDKYKANEQLGNFTHLTRQILEDSGKRKITVAGELRLLTRYLELEKMRFGDDFTFSLKVDDAVDPEYHELPPMIVQPFIENSLRHGLMHRKGKKRLDVHFGLDEPRGALRVTVTDNGIGREAAANIKKGAMAGYGSFSVESVRQRLALLAGEAADPLVLYEDLEVDGKAVGTRVTLFIPL